MAAGTDVNAKGRNGSTPLHSAASGGHGGIVELLIAKGADVNANSNYKTPLYPYGKTPLDWANRLSRITAANLLRKHGGKTAEELENAEPVTEAAKVEPTTAKASDISLHDAVEKGKIEAVKQHLAAGTDVNAKDMYGDIPLHWAASRGHTEVAELLIANGADVNAKTDDDGRAALMLAALNGHKEIVELLIASGADVNALKDDGKTPLDEAIGYSHTETADLLRKHGAKTGEELKATGN